MLTVNMKFLAPQLTILIVLLAVVKCNSQDNQNVNDLGCGKARSPYDRIVRGHDVGYMKYPWFATLLLKSMHDRLMCGGSLITKRHILTAAHCFKPFLPEEDTAENLVRKSGAGEKNWLSVVLTFLKPSSGSGGSIFSYGLRNKPLEDIYHVKLGVNDICEDESTQELYTTTKVILHEEYRSKIPFYDIAILELDRDVTKFNPICLPNKRITDDERAETGTIVGLGKTHEMDNKLPCKVKEAQVLTFNDTVCTNILKSKNETLTYKTNIFCAGYLGGKVDSCQGDSGGPLQILDEQYDRYYLNGLTSFGYGCAQPDVLGIYTDVSAYLEWIYSKIFPSNASSRMADPIPNVSELFRRQEALMTDSYPIEPIDAENYFKARALNASSVHSINFPATDKNGTLSDKPNDDATTTKVEHVSVSTTTEQVTSTTTQSSSSAPVAVSFSAPQASSSNVPHKPAHHGRKIRRKGYRQMYDLNQLLNL